MLLEIAIGDAYGAGLEYVSPKVVAEKNTLSAYFQHPRHRLAPGMYTDDTQMSLAVAEAIIARVPWTADHLAEQFVTVFKRDPREGYAQSFYGFLCQVSNGKEFLERIRPDSDKSGAAMRATPIGIFPSIEEVLSKCSDQAAITHNTPDGIRAAQAAASASHYFLYDRGQRADLGNYVASYVSGDWAVPWSGKVGQQGWMSVRAALTAVMQFDSLSDILRACVAFSGDVDTVAAIAMGIASNARDVRQDLPQALIDGLEDGPFGKKYVRELDEQLMATFRQLRDRPNDKSKSVSAR